MASKGKQLDEVKAALAALQEEIQEAKEERKNAKSQLEKATTEQDIQKFKALLESASANLTGLQGKEKVLMEEKNILTRSHSSSDEDTQEIFPVSEGSPKKRMRIQNLQKYTFYIIHKLNEKEIRCCVTRVTKNRFATFAHSPLDKIKENSVIEIYSVVNDFQYKVKVLKVEPKKDFILMEYDADDFQDEAALGVPYQGEAYIQLGLSATTQENTPYSVSKGVVTSVNHNSNGHFLGSAGSNPGESGGGYFSEITNTLYGINVGCERIPIHDNTTLFQLGTRHPARAHIVPSSYLFPLIKCLLQHSM
jgi:hypothetical protein